ncbi:glycosyltransferase involved in cell wall biosynthesis [Microlunatus panaciterrae]|uniref:4,4'-diaponeurosporenoate glycosyltransferase n=1 Tax=Microlunatus panaciterrae TaxID=400768 RepID=A0ABS2RHK4_9ACTN|nr:glycosyltransferase [Microlunatus panaciterrae]MBM7798490.1 glycosyltransferase involved in cell wall biosynthesis [Microlunatus panaciterrae]
MTSIVIAAHNEESVIGSCLDALLADPKVDQSEIIVAANGCTDNTAALARARGVRVIEVRQASKPAALNAGDGATDEFPRIYLDADIVVPSGGISAINEALQASSDADGSVPLAAVPGRRLITRGRPWTVRAYFAINERLPVFRAGLFGRGMIGLSAEGRARFDQFPEMVADDLFLDSLFAPGERVLVAGVETVVETPLTTGALLNRLVRVRRGNAAMRAAGAAGRIPPSVRSADRWSWLTDVVVPHPWLAPAAVVYVVLTTVAATWAQLGSRDDLTWRRDNSTRDSSRVSGGAS